MAIPSVVGASSNKGGGNLTVTLDAGLSIVATCTQAENLPTASSAQINHASSGWTCIVGTKGGAGYSDAAYDLGRYLYVFHKVTTAGETITTGDSGVFQVYQALTVTGYNTTTPLESVTTRARSSTIGGLATLGHGGESDDDTTGPDRLIVGFTTFDKDTNTAFAGTWAAASLSDVTTLTAQQSSLGTGGGLAGFYGGFASDSDGGEWDIATATDATYFLNNTLQATLAVVPEGEALSQSIDDTASVTDARLAAIGMVRADSASVTDAIAKAPGVAVADLAALADSCTPDLSEEVPQGQGTPGRGRRGIRGRAGQETRGRIRHGFGGQIG